MYGYGGAVGLSGAVLPTDAGVLPAASAKRGGCTAASVAAAVSGRVRAGTANRTERSACVRVRSGSADGGERVGAAAAAVAFVEHCDQRRAPASSALLAGASCRRGVALPELRLGRRELASGHTCSAGTRRARSRRPPRARTPRYVLVLENAKTRLFAQS